MIEKPLFELPADTKSRELLSNMLGEAFTLKAQVELLENQYKEIQQRAKDELSISPTVFKQLYAEYSTKEASSKKIVYEAIADAVEILEKHHGLK